MNITSDRLTEYLNQGLCYCGASQSFSPLYSNMGIDAHSGALYIHYNRQTSTLYAPFFSVPADGVCIEKVDSLHYKTAHFDGTLAFYDTDSFLMDWHGEEGLALCRQPGMHLAQQWTADTNPHFHLLQGYFRSTDRRDPDKKCAYLMGIRAIHGSITQIEDGSIRILPDSKHHGLVAICFACLSFSQEDMMAKLNRAPDSIQYAMEATNRWIFECTKELDLPISSCGEAKALSNAIRPLLMNLCKAPGQLRQYISAFPNRGTYPTHYLWDSCFQNLAYELLNPALARDSLLQLTSNLRPDGKMPQFICSTWSRPEEAQPALIGWAAERLEKISGHEDIGAILLPALTQNCQWWLNNRMTKYGLIETDNGLETGWDNSPRFDHGPILALDMNSYLIRQMRYVSSLCYRLERNHDGDAWEQKAQTLAQRLIALCYNPERNLFFDVHVETGKQLDVLTPAAFLPLWAGVAINETAKHAMIEKTLLSAEHFYAEIPFPSVAYSHPAYDCQDWWRGPTWIPVAYLMLEVLDQYGFKAQARAARERLYAIIQTDGKTHELFNSKTGEGLGSQEQGWTAACFLRLKYDLSQP